MRFLVNLCALLTKKMEKGKKKIKVLLFICLSSLCAFASAQSSYAQDATVTYSMITAPVNVPHISLQTSFDYYGQTFQLTNEDNSTDAPPFMEGPPPGTLVNPAAPFDVEFDFTIQATITLQATDIPGGGSPSAGTWKVTNEIACSATMPTGF